MGVVIVVGIVVRCIAVRGVRRCMKRQSVIVSNRVVEWHRCLLYEGVRSSCVSGFGKGVRSCVGFTGQGSQWVGMGRDVLGKVRGVGKRI